MITYNLLNLPQQLVLSGGRNIKNTYAADGRKLFASATENNQPVSDGTRYYNGNLVFDINGELEYILMPEGRILNNNGTYEYEYHLKDHLGSVRVAFVPTVNGKEVVQENAYYPFGATIADLSYAAPLNNNRYGYTGQEQLNDFDLNWYDYIARNYNPLIGRFNSVDPMANKYPHLSPYAYCNNNPVKYVDPDGRDVIIHYMGDERMAAFDRFMKTKSGEAFVAQFLNKGESVKIRMSDGSFKDYDFTASETGVYANATLRYFSQANLPANVAGRAYTFHKGSFDKLLRSDPGITLKDIGKLQQSGSFEIGIALSGLMNRTIVEWAETLGHEAFVHSITNAATVKRIIDALKNGDTNYTKLMSILQEESTNSIEDHDRLKQGKIEEYNQYMRELKRILNEE